MRASLFVLLAVAAIGSQALARQQSTPGAGCCGTCRAGRPCASASAGAGHAPIDGETRGAGPFTGARTTRAAGSATAPRLPGGRGHRVAERHRAGRGRATTSLTSTRTEFSVFEDGVKQEITFFNRRQQPIALSLLLDSSASMEDKLDMLQIAAKSFVKRLKPNDIAQVIDFDSRVEIRQAFTGNLAELESAIGKTAAGGSTSLHNAIYIALKELRKVRAVSEEDVRRQALVVFSDGEDTSSLISFDEVLDLAKRSETGIYTIALRGVDTQTKGFREAEFVMRQLAQETGGRVRSSRHGSRN